MDVRGELDLIKMSFIEYCNPKTSRQTSQRIVANVSVWDERRARGLGLRCLLWNVELDIKEGRSVVFVFTQLGR